MRSGVRLLYCKRKQREDMGHGGFQLGNDPLHAPAEIGVENHRRNADGQAGGGIDERLADAARKQGVTGRAQIGARARRTT